LLQRGFPGTSHPAASDPYFPAASNAGSLWHCLPACRRAAFSAVRAEPLVGIGAGALACGIARVGTVMPATGTQVAARPQPKRLVRRRRRQRARWVGYAFVPSALLLAVTAQSRSISPRRRCSGHPAGGLIC
jgi:hypothetical protein